MTITPPSQDDARDTSANTTGQRGTDERREAVNPAENPAPSSPEPDPDAVRKGEETLERVKPY
jgi:hypothetical protein